MAQRLGQRERGRAFAKAPLQSLPSLDLNLCCCWVQALEQYGDIDVFTSSFKPMRNTIRWGRARCAGRSFPVPWSFAGAAGGWRVGARSCKPMHNTTPPASWWWWWWCVCVWGVCVWGGGGAAGRGGGGLQRPWAWCRDKGWRAVQVAQDTAAWLPDL